MLDSAAQTFTGYVTEFGLSAVGALAVLFVGSWIAKRIRAALRSHLSGTKIDATLIPFVSALVYWGIMAFVILAVLGIFGVPTASAIAVFGAAGLAVGLALQGTLSNFAAGVMLLIFRPFNVGDWVEVSGVAGSVKEISIFNTILATGDNVKVVVPNSKVFGQEIKNYTAHETRRIDLVMGVGYDDDLQVARDTMMEVLTGDERVLEEPAPNIQVMNLGDSSVDFIVRPWCQTSDYWPLRWDLTWRMKEGLEAAGCNIPYPQRDVHLFQENAD
ncbi:MAG: mechanosensitive ion channel family protein [Gemmatimonadales bacterium]|nr:MAG: mechanosensitive ion channel family protein [Gemmatimonadales bacterium]